MPTIQGEPLGFPWFIAFPNGATVTVSAGFGIGKSSAAAMANPDVWFTTEQFPIDVARMFTRLKRPMPAIFPLVGENAVDQILRELSNLHIGAGSIIVIDSLTPFGLDDAVRVMLAVIDNCRRTGRRAIFVLQTNKERDAAGSVKLQFTPDVVGEIVTDAFDQRLFRWVKNRFGPVASTYFTFSKDGMLVPPVFEHAPYSVEGNGVNLELIPYGVSGTRYTGIMDALARIGVLADFPGHASSGLASLGTRCGFLEPPDLFARKAFAERHGLKWLELDTALDLLARARPEKVVAD